MNNVIVVGSGAGGAAVARELAFYGINVTLLEKGRSIQTENAHQCYDNLDVGVELLKATCLGGTTLVRLACCAVCQKVGNQGYTLKIILGT